MDKHVFIPGGDNFVNQYGQFTVVGRFFTREEIESIGNGDYARGKPVSRRRDVPVGSEND